MEDSQWSDAKAAWLRTLWDEGFSESTIAEKLGTSKNAVAGKARRMHLPERGSPLHGGPTQWKGGAPNRGRPSGAHKAPTNTLPPLPSLQETLEETS